MSLLKLNTPRNLQYLDRLLTLVMDPNKPWFKPFWQEFGDAFGALAQDAASEAIQRLTEIHKFVRKQRGMR